MSRLIDKYEVNPAPNDVNYDISRLIDNIQSCKYFASLKKLSHNLLITNNADELCCGWNGPIDYYTNADFDVKPDDIYARKYFLHRLLKYSCLSIP